MREIKRLRSEIKTSSHLNDNFPDRHLEIELFVSQRPQHLVDSPLLNLSKSSTNTKSHQLIW